jgi:hypothetical protein
VLACRLAVPIGDFDEMTPRLPHRLDADPGRTRRRCRPTFVLADVGPHISCVPTGTRHRLTRRGEHARDPKAQVRSRFHAIAVGKTAYAQLRLARHLVDDLRRPWHPRPDPGKPLSPCKVRLGFRRLRARIGTPAGPPKPAHPGPGRPKGSKNRPKSRRPTYRKSEPATSKHEE